MEGRQGEWKKVTSEEIDVLVKTKRYMQESRRILRLLGNIKGIWGHTSGNCGLRVKMA